MASSLDQVGPLTKTVEDAAIVLSVIAGFDIHDATTGESDARDYTEVLDGKVQGLRIGIPKEYFAEELDERVRKVAEEAIERFRLLGAEIVPISLPRSKYALSVYYLVMPCEVSSNLARYDGIRFGLSINDAEDSIPGTSGLLETYLDTRRYGFGREVKRRIMLGTYALSAGYYDAYYKKAQQVRRLIREDFKAAFETVDFIFSPTAPEVAFKLGEKSSDPLKMYLSDVYTVTANLVGVPAISFPMGMIEDDGKELPIGGQLMGRWYDEEGVLRMADAFERSSKQ
jgi:aspartyl-tRNA(Asn)/glutamyl-tRNA(Gln) amidotransferase subunit A